MVSLKKEIIQLTKITGNPASVVLEAGAHKISKADSATIALIKLVPVTE